MSLSFIVLDMRGLGNRSTDTTDTTRNVSD